MATGHSRPSSKSKHAPLPPPMKNSTLTTLQSAISANPLQSNSTDQPKPIIKDLRQANLLNEVYSFGTNKTQVQETVEVIPQPVSCERVFYSYTNDHTDMRSRESIKIDLNNSKQGKITNCFKKLYQNIDNDKRSKTDGYSSTLFIFPKQRNEKYISEIHYVPEHITIRYKTSLELLTKKLKSFQNHYYQNIHDFYHLSKDVFYRI